MGGRSSRPDPYIEARKRSLRNQDIINNDIEISINDLRNKQKVLQDIINTKTVELANANNELTLLKYDTNQKYINKNMLEYYKSQLETQKKQLEYVIYTSTQELEDIIQYINLQKRNILYSDKEHNRLYNKVVVRNQLQYDGYIKRNDILNRSLNRLEQKYSNNNVDSEYQRQHNEYFLTLNAIGWWIYYLLFIVICYQIVYIQSELSLMMKIIWIIILAIFPLSFKIYDLVVAKI